MHRVTPSAPAYFIGLLQSTVRYQSLIVDHLRALPLRSPYGCFLTTSFGQYELVIVVIITHDLQIYKHLFSKNDTFYIGITIKIH